jgi:hypothetical protein
MLKLLKINNRISIYKIKIEKKSYRIDDKIKLSKQNFRADNNQIKENYTKKLNHFKIKFQNK